MSFVNTNVSETFGMIQQTTKKPVFVQPSTFKMAVQELDMISDDEGDLADNICEKISLKGMTQECHKLSQMPSSKECNWAGIEAQYEKSKLHCACEQTLN